jgi:uncharacterized protein YjlB
MNALVRTQDDLSAGVHALWFEADGWVPNNPRLPVVLYRQAIPTTTTDGANVFETLFRCNDWAPQWRNGIYSFHHYHSNAHEVLGIASGNACVQLGGPKGADINITAGDCMLLPAGTGHCLLDASPELLVIGAYPPGQSWDLRRDALSSEELAAMMSLPIPRTDPVTGTEGALKKFWVRSD